MWLSTRGFQSSAAHREIYNIVGSQTQCRKRHKPLENRGRICTDLSIEFHTQFSSLLSSAAICLVHFYFDTKVAVSLCTVLKDNSFFVHSVRAHIWVAYTRFSRFEVTFFLPNTRQITQQSVDNFLPRVRADPILTASQLFSVYNNIIEFQSLWSNFFPSDFDSD